MAFDSFLDARKIEDGTELAAQVCIVGAGAAGITIARELVRAGIEVCLLEAGGLSIDPQVDALSVIENAGRDYNPNAKRLRLFGGTTNHWGGHCVPLRREDFKPVEGIAHTGWPFGFDELLPYYRRAHDQLGIGPFAYDAADEAAQLSKASLMEFDGRRVENTVSHYKRVRFGLTYGDELAAAANLRCVLYADVTACELDSAEGDSVKAVQVRSLAGNRFSVRARFFIIACGGIENARLLLASNSQRPAGLGNHSDMVGRFFSEHLWFESGFIAPNRPVDAYHHYMEETPAKIAAVRFHIALTYKAQLELRIPAFRAELRSISASYWDAKRIKEGGGDPATVALLLSKPFKLGHTLRCRSTTPPDVLLLGNHVEQTPNPDSRVTLSAKRDALGRQNPRLAWRLQAVDKEGVMKAHALLAREIGRVGVGRMRIDLYDPQEMEIGADGGAHHMGTTRMHDSPRQGVTDADSLVFNTHNLYLAGSSLFPTCGYANPTLTIVAMSLRLADTIKGRLRESESA